MNTFLVYFFIVVIAVYNFFVRIYRLWLIVTKQKHKAHYDHKTGILCIDKEKDNE